MYLSRLGSGIATTAALLWIGASCSGNEPQETADTESVAQQADSTATKLAVEEEPIRSEEKQTINGKLDENNTQTDRNSEQLRRIPLSEILTSSPQKGMAHPRQTFQQQSDDQDYTITKRHLQQILQGTKGGASNAFLVDAANINDAIAASSSIFLGSRSAGTPAPINTPDPIRGNYWFVVYLGSGPSRPTWWTVENVTLGKNRVRLTFRESRPTSVTRDVRHYYYWIPLGELQPHSYELELYDAKLKAISLMRRVEVTPKN